MKLHGFMKYFRFHQFENLKIWVLANFMLLKLPKYAFLTFLKIKISTLNNFCEATISHLLQITSSTLSKIDLGLGTHFYQLDCILINLFQFCVKSIFPNILFSQGIFLPMPNQKYFLIPQYPFLPSRLHVDQPISFFRQIKFTKYFLHKYHNYIPISYQI